MNAFFNLMISWTSSFVSFLLNLPFMQEFTFGYFLLGFMMLSVLIGIFISSVTMFSRGLAKW